MNTRLYVANIPYSTAPDDLRDLFTSRDRNVMDVHIVHDRETGRPKGIAFIEMENEEQLQNAIDELDDIDFGGRRLSVRLARPRKTRERPQRTARTEHPARSRRSRRTRRPRSHWD